ncbi:ATP-binding protein [Ruania zhangjianzhongii]|uniref:ATP-binding protein n=1 Tax=Ruania zhangjianzhongii TaxID=2603206 RepID=UPI0011C72E95|nr:ATP-binding protein [Ruania zhangjianzhongii]
MTEQGGRAVTSTHDWTSAVDHDHLQAIRAEAGAYAASGAAHLVLEVLAHADEEAYALDRVGRAVLTQHADGSLSVADDGRGTAIRRDTAGRVVRKPVMSTQDLRFFAASDPPLLPDGRPRRGMSTVAALSRWLEHTNRRAEGSWTQRYVRGVPVTELVELPGTGQTGTTIRFLPDLAVSKLHLGEELSGFAHLHVEVRR